MIEYHKEGYEYSYHKAMLIGDYKGQRFIADFRDFSIYTPVSLYLARKKIEWSFKALFGNIN